MIELIEIVIWIGHKPNIFCQRKIKLNKQREKNILMRKDNESKK